MVEEEITGGQDARTEGGQEAKNQTWHMRCTPSQKELLQQLVSLSGQSAAEFLLLAATESLPKSKAQSELEKDYSQVLY